MSNENPEQNDVQETSVIETEDARAREESDVTAPYDEEERSPRTNPVSVTYLVFGLVFIGGALTWWLRDLDAIDEDASRWVLPLVLVVAGSVGLVAWVAKSLRSAR